MIIRTVASTTEPPLLCHRCPSGGKGEVCPLVKKRTFGYLKGLLTKEKTGEKYLLIDKLPVRYHKILPGIWEKYRTEKLKIPYKKICSIEVRTVD